MKRHITFRVLAVLVLAAGFAGAPAAQPAQPPAPAPDYNAGGLPRTPAYQAVEGQPIDTRTPEKKTDTRQFPQQTRAPYHHAADFKVAVLTNQLHAAWAMALLPDGKILITERLPGALRILDNGKLSAPLAGLEGLHVSTPMTGLLDVVPDPDFAANHTIFFTFFEYLDKTVGNTSVARAVLDEKAGAIRDVKVILRTSPLLPNDQTLAAGTKTGGRIAVGRDGYLYVTIGDRDNAGPRPWGVAQILDTHLGKVIRITKDGAPAPGNPFLGQKGALPEIWAYGLRSPEGLAFRPGTDELYEVEHGPRGGDELNLIQKGKNYGWPIISHGIDYRGAPIGDGAVAMAGMEQPVYYWSPSTAPSGLAFYRGNLFPQWKDNVFIGMLNGRQLDRVRLADGKVAEEEALLTDLKARIRDVRVGEDGAVYVLTDSGGTAISEVTPATGQVLKLTPK
ncbi:MAG TPA: PQQ-dependent sugar dehydrogenase [Rhizomicrobium sp.]|nr:PQQ-dependent sugar dehydrogenase [Rhizomicrobium sp.]